jgi:hypothetical protein
MHPCWTLGDAFASCNEGRSSELSRRVTFAVLFTARGKPGTWLLLVAVLWGLVTATTLGSMA